MEQRLVTDLNLNQVLVGKIKKEKLFIESKDAEDLLVPERFDLLAKYLYVKYYVEDIQTEFAKKLYLKHIELFNGFYEADGSNKMGPDKFIAAFNKVIDSMQQNGFETQYPIPYNNDKVILDGAHRLATALYFGYSINCVKATVKSKSYDYKFFESLGLDVSHMDAMVMEYIKLKKEKLYLVFIWPTSGGGKKDALDKVLKKYGKKVYQKAVNLSTNGSVNLIRKIYKSEDWLGSYKDGFIGAKNKAQWCFEGTHPLDVILFESDENMILMKDEIRDIFKVNKHSVHITDTHEEVKELSGLLFNKNSLEWLNISIPRSFSWFEKLISHYKTWLSEKTFNKEQFCVDGSASLSAFGLRTARDLDFLYSGNRNVGTGFKEIDCHNSRFENKGQIDEIIYNPENYFHYNSLKFLSLEQLLEFKVNRGEEKDLEDIELIKDLRKGKSHVAPFKQRILKKTRASYWKGRIKFILLKVRYNLVRILNEIKG